MMKTLKNVAGLLAVTLLFTRSSEAVAMVPLKWTCDSSGPKFSQTGLQWFDINVEQDNCRQACEKAGALAEAVDACKGDTITEGLKNMRETTWSVLIATDPEEPPSEATQSVLAQYKKCDDARTECGTLALEFLDLVVEGDTDQELRRKCINACGKSSSTCNAVLTRGGGSPPVSNSEILVEASRNLTNFCARGTILVLTP